MRYSRNKRLFPPYLLLQFRPNGQKTDMVQSSEQKIDGKIGIFGRFAVQNTMPDMFVWLEQRSDAITSNFAVREYLNTGARWNARIEGESVFRGERPCRKECLRPQIARRSQFRHPFVAQMSRFCAIRGTRAYFHLICCCNLDRTDKKRTCCGPRNKK